MKTDSTEVHDADLSAMLALIDRQTATIKRQQTTIEEIMGQLTRASAIIDKLTARLSEYEWERTHAAVLSTTPACVAPNGWN